MIVENKNTGDKAIFDYIHTGNTKTNGEMIKKQLSKCAYELGCDVSNLIITKKPIN